MTARHAGDPSRQGLHVESFPWRSVADLEPQALGLTYWLDPGSEGRPYPATIRFTGRRIGVRGKPGPRDRLNRDETIESVVPGSGPIAVTTRVRDITPGEWRITATPIHSSHESREIRAASRHRPSQPPASSSGTTAYAPAIQVRAPGAHLGAWPALVGLGAIVGLIVQSLVAGRVGLPVPRVLIVSLVACVAGLGGAKLSYLTGHFIGGEREVGNLFSGACIQGFVLGAGLSLLAGARVLGLPIGLLLDATASGLLLGMAVGRFGCFYGGCCAGRPTASRWGLWSSDRHLGMRRVPVQLLESALALLVGAGALLLTWGQARPSGVVFVWAIATYTLGRQILFPLRAAPRHTAYGRVVTMGLTVLVLVADIGVALAR